LEILFKLLQNIATKTSPEAGQTFYQAYYMLLLEHILSVVTDASQAQVAGGIRLISLSTNCCQPP